MKQRCLFLIAAMVFAVTLHSQDFREPLTDTLTVAELEKDVGMPFDSLRFYAEAGSPEARMYLASYYMLSAERNAALARKWFSMAASDGYPGAAFALGTMYHEGDGAIRDLKKAFAYFFQDAEAGVPPAVCAVADAYIKGEGVEQNNDSAFYWASRGAEIEEPTAMNLLSQMYYHGVGTKIDKEASFRWAYRSANAGCADGMVMLAAMFVAGEVVEQNADKAYEWMMKADSLGVNVPTELKEGVDELRKVNRRFEKYGLTLKKYYNLPDVELRRVTMEMANTGDAEAQYFLAGMYYGGHHGMKKDFNKARYWYREAKKNGYAHAGEVLEELGW